jgi:hypothetical protein
VTVAAIGDRSATIAWAPAGDAATEMRWQTLALREATGTRITERDPQLEAIAVDGALGVLLVQEWPCRAEYIDARQRRVVAHVSLDIPVGAGSKELRRSWADAAGSHAEGVVLLKAHHLLIVKEKDPAALLEFGPAGDAPLGFGTGQWLDPGQPWWQGAGDDSPRQVPLVLLASWDPTPATTAACPDLSDAEVGLRGNLVLLSDKGRSIAVVAATGPAEHPFSGSFEPIVVWRISGIEDKPEGIAMLPDGDVLVACDRRKPTKNLFRIRRSQWDQD